MNIDPQNNPIRTQSSLGSNVKQRNIDNTQDNYGIFLATVTNVQYKEGTIDFKTNDMTENIVNRGLGGGVGHAPIPVETFGTNAQGKVYGHYRPINIGDTVAIAYMHGDMRTPLVLGVYPQNSQGYELVSPAPTNEPNGNDEERQYENLGERVIYPSQQLYYETGKGDIFRSFGGKSFLQIADDQDTKITRDLDYAYDTVMQFYNTNGEGQLEPEQEKAQSWLLVHEDNPDSVDSDGHRTRFYVSDDGTLQIVLTNVNQVGILILEGSLSDGFTIKKQYDTSVVADESGDTTKSPSTNFVSLNIGGDKGFNLDVYNDPNSDPNAGDTTVYMPNGRVTTFRKQTNFNVQPDDVYVNGKGLTDILNEHDTDLSDITDTINKNQESNKEYFEKLERETHQAGLEAKAAADDAKQAGAHAHDAGEKAKAVASDIKNKIVYYMNVSPEEDVYVPQKYLVIHTDTFIEDLTVKKGMIEDLAVDNAQIAYEAVGQAEIEDLAVSNAKIANLAVSDEKVGHLTFNHMIGETIDANKINVVHLKADSIDAGTITADKLIINNLGDISEHLGNITDGKMNAGEDGVEINNLPADDPDMWTPAKKLVLKQRIHILEAEANSSIQYAQDVGLNADECAKAKEDLLNGTAQLLTDMTKTERFDSKKISDWMDAVKQAVESFRNMANSELNRQIGQTVSGNRIFQGTQSPEDPKEGDLWFHEHGDGTTSIEVYDGNEFYSPNDAAVKHVADKVSNMPSSYYQHDEPMGEFVEGDTWYQTNTDEDGKLYFIQHRYTNGKWKEMLPDNVNKNTSGTSAPANPRPGDQWYDETTKELKQLNDQGTDWIVIPTQGPQGVPGADGKPSYTWIKYAKDKNGTSMSDNPEGMDYIGLAYNKDSADESSIATDYTWSLFKGAKGDQGIPGANGKDGKPSYTWIKYADSPTSGMSDSPDGKQYMGIVTNKDTATESSDYSDYTWSLINDNSKKRNFVDTPTTPYDIGDTWTQSGATYYCTTPRKSGAFDKSDWTMQQLTITSLSDDVKNGIDQINNLQIGGTNLITGTSGPFVMGYGIPNTTWDTTNQVSGISLPLTSMHTEVLPQGTGFPYTWMPGVTYTQSIYISTDAPLTGTPISFTWFTDQYGHDTRGSDNLVKVSTNVYRATSTYTWPSSNSPAVGRYRNADLDNLTQVFDFTKGTFLQFYKPKLEHGNKATDWSPAPEDMATVGGRNYIENSQPTNDSGWNFKSNGTVDYKVVDGQYIEITRTGGGYHQINRQYQNDKDGWYSEIKPGDQFAISLDISMPTIPTVDSNFYGQLRLNAGDTFNSTQKFWNLKDIIKKANTWYRVSGVTDIPAHWETDFTKATRARFLIESHSGSDTDVIRIRNIKLEKGTKATDWTPAPEDMVNKQTAYKGVTLNDSGLTATSGDTQVAMNSDDGFLIKNGSKTLLNADKSGNLTMQGDITAGNISGVNFMGNDLSLAGSMKVSGAILSGNGRVALSNNGLNIKGAGFTLGDRKGNTTVKIDDDGTFTANKAALSGSLTSNSVAITGGTISMNGGAFSVDRSGNVTAKSFTSDSLFNNGTIDFKNMKVKSLSADYIVGGTIDSSNMKVANGDTTTMIGKNGLSQVNSDEHYNIVYNSEFSEGTIGWNLDTEAYETNLEPTVNGSNRIGVNNARHNNDYTAGYHTLAKSNPQRVIAGSKISASVQVLVLQDWGGVTFPRAKASVRFYDSSGQDIGHQADLYVNVKDTSGKFQYIKAENVTVPSNAERTGMILQVGGPGHGHIIWTQPYITPFSTVGAYTPDTVSNNNRINISDGAITFPIQETHMLPKTWLNFSGGDLTTVVANGIAYLSGSGFTINDQVHDPNSARTVYFESLNISPNSIATSIIDNYNKNTVYKASMSSEGGFTISKNSVDEGELVVSSNLMPSYLKLGTASFLVNDSENLHINTGNGTDLNLGSDSRSFVSSMAVYNRTYSGSANMLVTSYGTLGRATSASKYKLDISDVDNLTEKAQSFLAVKPKQWFDKQETQDFADKLMGNDIIQESPTVNHHAGFIAEDLAVAGLNEFISYGADGSLEGIQYDRLPILHHELLRQAYNKIDYLMTQLNIMDKRISKLEGDK